jgi:hypothetical protein
MCARCITDQKFLAKKKKTGVPQARYSPASLIGHFPVSMNESLFKSGCAKKKKVEHVDQIPSNHVWNCGKNEILNGIVLMQKWAFLQGIMFNKIYVLYFI